MTTPYSEPVTDQPTDTLPDPSAVADASASTGAAPPDSATGVSGLSDTANAMLHPDVEHPDPPQLPPEALQVPPPIAERESTLLDIIRAYATGQTDWPTTKQALIDFDYAPMPPRVGSPTGPTKGDWWNDVEADIGTDAPDNTWAQLQEATYAGMLSRDERNEVLAARAQNQAEQEQQAGAAGGDPKPREGKAVKFDPRKHPHGVGGRWARVKLGHAQELLAHGTASDAVMVDQLKPGDVILHPGTEYHEPVVVTKVIAHPRKTDPHMQWRTIGLHNGTDEQIIDKVHQGDYADRLRDVPDPTTDELVPAGAPTAKPLGGSQLDAQEPLQLPRTRRTSLLDNNTPVIHEDGRVGRVRHVTVSHLRTGHTLVNPVTGAHAGYVTDVHVRPTRDKRVQADDRTPLGMDRFVSVDDQPHTGMAMGARYTVFEPFPTGPEVPKPAKPKPFRLGAASQAEVADALDKGHVRIRSQAGDRVWLEHGTTELTYDRVPGGPKEGQWHGAYVSEYGRVSGTHPHGEVTDAGLRKHLDTARHRAKELEHAKQLAEHLFNDKVDYDTAEGHFLDTFTGQDEAHNDAIMRILDNVYGK